MPILHTVSRSPFERPALESCLRHALPGSGVLLIEDAVYAALAPSAPARLLAGALGSVAVYALGPDLEARGIPAGRMVEGVRVVDYEGFVALCVEFDKVQAWL